MWSYHIALSVSAWFSQWCFVLVCTSYASEVQLDFHMTVLLWAIYYLHGMAKGEAEINHAWAFQALLRWSFKPFPRLQSGCITSSLLAAVSVHAAQEWPRVWSVFCRNSPVFSKRWTSLWHFRRWFPGLWSSLHLIPVPSKRKVLQKTLTPVIRP